MTNKTFRYDINSLRALAVIAVVTYHFGENLLPGGFIGVDIFFVISGFLMTKIVYEKYRNKSFSIYQFYTARAKRIIPALAVLCCLLLLYGWFFLLPTDFQLLAKHIVSSLTFLSNIVYWTESGYFDLAAKEKWLLHTWSLSLEWQFYIAFPIFLYALLRYLPLRFVKLTLLITTLACLIVSLILTDMKPSLGFYSLPTRSWELLAGSLSFFYPINIEEKQKNIWGCVSILTIFLSLIFISDNLAWPSLVTSVPVIATVILLALNLSWVMLRSNILNFFGNISYSLYLWHWPLTVLLVYLGQQNNLPSILTAIGISICLAYISYKYIETPCRKVKSTFIKSLITYLITIIFALFIYLTHGAKLEIRPVSISEQANFVEKYKGYKIDPDGYWLKCSTKNNHESSGIFEVDNSCLKSNKGGISLGVREFIANEQSFSQLASPGCHPYFPEFKQNHLKGNGAEACKMSNSKALEYIIRTPPHTVILTQAKDALNYDWDKLAKAIIENGVQQVLLIGPTPQWQPNLVSTIANRHWHNKNGYIVDASLDEAILDIDKKLHIKYIDSPNLTYISTVEFLCVQDKKVSCKAIIFNQENKYPLVFDYGHLTKEGAIAIAESAIKSYIADM
ncbi:acyltransferase family protein [Pseudoalteromonas sp. G4]|uniref:acyltransferase family protein n=1 Tax=Pseudoalteromonas sp. G4 TaxID=2992761 RepID=UPI00237DE4A7|nr:acyltransferase family protein [Pseudoalteromonas sp. G4]MDE3271251.1 acyltransferase [Pseudoalteromonas sp. G4]